MGLWVAPEIPAEKLRGALGDYGRGVVADEVVALFDGTVFGSAKDGILFLTDRLVAQESNLHEPRTIRYRDVVGARARRNLLGGRRVEVEIARGRTTVTERLDFTAHGEAAAHVARLLEALLLEPAEPPAGTDRRAVVAALDRLVSDGRLTEGDRSAMIEALDGGRSRPA
jgi:hypothetical protein